MNHLLHRRAAIFVAAASAAAAVGLFLAPSALAAPAAPGCLVAQVGGSANSVALTWNAVPGATSYEVHEDLYNGYDNLVTTVTGTTRTSGTLAAGHYDYYVKAKDSTGALSGPSPKDAVTVPMGSTAVHDPSGCDPAAASPTAAFTESPASGSTPLAVSFTDDSTGPATSWSWNFGDGSAQVATQNASHTYSTAGTYTVTHTASNWQGVATSTQTVTADAPAGDPPPVASFSENPASGTAPLAVQFTDTSTNGPTSWSWDFGDGSAASTTQSPSHTFTAAGTYTVTETATNSAGSSQATHTVSVSAAQQQTGNCLPDPHLCGYPDATNTGVPAGTVLKPYTGPLTISTPGTVINGADIVGYVYVHAANVTIENSRIRPPNDYVATPNNNWLVYVDEPGFTLTDSELSGRGPNGDPTACTVNLGLDGSGTTLAKHLVQRVNMHDCGDGIRGGNYTAKDDYTHDFWSGVINGKQYDTPHADAYQSLGADNESNIVIDHDTAYNPYPPPASGNWTGGGYPNSVFQSNDENGVLKNVEIKNSLLDGGGFCFNINANTQGFSVHDNRFGHDEQYGLMLSHGASYTWANNVWDDTGSPASG